MDELREFIRKVWFIFQKELLATIKDPKSAAVLIAPVFLQCILFGYVANYNLNNVPYVVLDNSHSKYSSDLLAKLDGSGVFTRIDNISSEKQIAEYIDEDKVLVALNIEREFAKHIEKGETAKVQVITDGRNSTTAGLAASYVSSIVSAYNTQLQGGKSLVEVRTRVWYNENEITQWNFLTAMTPMLCVSQILMLAGLCVARERENGTFDQLLVTPLTSMQILIGKALPPMVMGMFQASIAVIICKLWFQVPMMGSVWLLFFTLAIFMLSIVGLGLCISAVSDTMQQVMVYAMVVMLPMNLLSGMSTPVSNMPQLLQYFTYVNPLRFAIDGVRRIYLAGATFDQLVGNYIPMLCVAAVTMPLAAWMFRNKLQ